MVNFYWYDLIIVPGIFQGFLLALAFSRMRDGNRANGVLSLFLVAATIMLIGRLAWFRVQSPEILQLSLFFDGFIFLFGPLLLRYTRCLLTPEKKKRLSFYHYIPLVIHLGIACILTFSFSAESYIANMQKGRFNLTFHLIIVTAIIHNLLYIGYSLKLIRTATTDDKIGLSHTAKKFINYILITAMACILLWAFSFINELTFGRSLVYLGYDFMWIILSLLIFVIAYYSLKEPKLFREAISPKKDLSKPSARSKQATKNSWPAWNIK